MPGYALAVPVMPRSVSAPLWRALSAATAPASINELHIATAAHPNAIQLRLKRWERAGLVAATSTNPRRFIMADKATTPPVMKADGTVHRPGTMRKAIWGALRVLKTFDVLTLHKASHGASYRSTEDFVNVLCRAGYLRRQPARERHGLTTYSLTRAVGRKAPVVTHAKTPAGRVRILVDRNDGSRHDVSPGRVSLHTAAGARAAALVDGGVS